MPIVELITPIYGKFRYFALSRAKQYGLIIVEKTVIVFEYSAAAGDYRKSAGHQNGLIVEYFKFEIPFELSHFYVNSEVPELWLCAENGNLHQLTIAIEISLLTTLGRDTVGSNLNESDQKLQSIRISDSWSPPTELKLFGKFSNVAALGETVVLQELSLSSE